MILTGNAYAPDGRLLHRGQTLPDDVGEDFTRDIADLLVANDAHPLLRLPTGSEEQIAAGWRKIHEYDAEDDPLLVVAADRLRHAAAGIGAHRLARLRPFVDSLPDDESPGEEPVRLEGTSRRNRRTQS